MANNTMNQPPIVLPVPAPGTSVVGPPPSPTRKGKRTRQGPDFKLWLLLLLVICLGGIGSFPLVSIRLPNTTGLPGTQPTQQPSTAGGKCTATPQEIKYELTTQQTPPPALPADWSKAGRQQSDLGYAQACAASFVLAYQKFSASDPKTFETSVPLLSEGAKQRFYGRVTNIKSDPHMEPLWRANVQKHHMQQQAQVGIPTLLDARYTRGKLLAWLLVPYKIFTQMDEDSIEQGLQMTVLLVGVPFNPQDAGTGWQVSDWKSEQTVFAEPDPL